MKPTLTSIVNGVAMSLVVRPNGSKVPVLSASAADKAGLKSSWIKVQARVGPTKVAGFTAVTRYTLPGTALKRRIGWFERTLQPGINVLLGPGAVSQPVVAFQLRAPTSGERLYRLPLIDRGYGGMGTNVRFGKQVIAVEFSPYENASVVTAAAGAVLSQNLGGKFVGGSFMREVVFGIARPHRRLELERPLTFGPFRLSSLFARTSSEALTADSDPDEIVVTAKKKGGGQAHMELGREALSGCSSLTFDKSKREIRLMCG